MALSRKIFSVKTLVSTLLRDNNPAGLINNIRLYLPPENFGLFADEILKNSSSNNKISLLKKVDDYNDLQLIQTLKSVDPRIEIGWMKAFLSRNITRLDEYFVLSAAYSKALMMGDYEKASSILDNIENIYGYSIWLIKTRIAFHQLTGGLHAQKTYSNSVKSEVGHKGIIAYMTFWISLRNEGSVTSYRFSQLFHQNFKLWNSTTKKDLGVYMRYHILGDEPVSPEDALNLVRIDFSRSLIDFYESFLTLCRIASLSESELKSSIYYTIQSIVGKCKDLRLTVLRRMYDVKTDIPLINDASFVSYDHLVRGDIDDALNVSNEGLIKTPDDPYLIFINAFANSLLNNKEIENIDITEFDSTDSVRPLKEILIGSLSAIFAKGIGAAPSLNKLEKLALNFNNLSWSGIFELSLYYLDPEKTNKRFVLLSLLKTHSVHPLLLKVAEKEVIFDNCVSCVLSHFTSVGVQYALVVCDELDNDLDSLGIIKEEIDLFKGNKCFESGDFEMAISFAHNLTQSNYTFFQRQGYYLMTYSLVGLNKILEACEYIAALYVKNTSLATLFPLNKLAELLKPSTEEWNAVRQSISLSIILDAIVKNIDNKAESYRAYACEDYLTYNGLIKPSQLTFDGSAEMIYYLRRLCVESIMDVSTAYTSPEDVENERIVVLRRLLEVDGGNSKQYSLEIKNLLRSQIIKTKMHEIEQIKIYVDLEKVRQWAHSELEESYHRYLVYLRHGLDPITSAKSIEAVEKSYEKDYSGLINMEVPINESFALIKSIIDELREAYCLSPEFGLDRYLSTRLRHGAIESQLRKALDKHHIITKKEGKKGAYKKNYFWQEKIGKNEYINRDFDAFFNRFSERYDKLIAEISLEWVTINRGNNTQALFMPPLRNGEIAYLQSKISITTTFSQFLDVVIKYFEERLSGG